MSTALVSLRLSLMKLQLELPLVCVSAVYLRDLHKIDEKIGYTPPPPLQEMKACLSFYRAAVCRAVFPIA